MSAEAYTGLFRKNRQLVDNGSCAVMNALRADALAPELLANICIFR